jgi:uncharacterized protein YecT (DUF1311 family)
MILLAMAMMAAAQGGACRSPQTQSEMNRCAGLDFARADAALNLAWRQAVAAERQQDADAADGRPSAEATLRDAQRAWLTFRDSHCTVEGYAARGGTMESMLYNGCRARLTRERTGQLRSLGRGN